MAFLSSFDISGYGLSAQRFRINVVSSNIANANSTRTDEGGAYRRREVIFKAFDFDQRRRISTMWVCGLLFTKY